MCAAICLLRFRLLVHVGSPVALLLSVRCQKSRYSRTHTTMTNIINPAIQYPACNYCQHIQDWHGSFKDYAPFFAALVGAAMGAAFSHWLLLRRDKKARLHLFLSFMCQLKGVVLHVWPHGDFATNYRNTIPNIAHAAAPVLCDLDGIRGADFERMINSLCGYGDKAKENQNKILEDIDAITGFFDT